MEPDIEGTLRRVVLDVFDEDVDVTFEAQPDAPHKRGLFRTGPVLTIAVNGKEWALGRRTSRVHYAEDTSAGDRQS